MTMDKQAADDVQKIDSMDSEWTKYWILLYKTQLCPFIHHLPAQILTLETGHIEKNPLFSEDRYICLRWTRMQVMFNSVCPEHS